MTAGREATSPPSSIWIPARPKPAVCLTCVYGLEPDLLASRAQDAVGHHTLQEQRAGPSTSSRESMQACMVAQGHAACPVRSVTGWQAGAKPQWDIIHLRRAVSGASIPMPRALLKLVLSLLVPRLLQRSILSALLPELGKYLVEADQAVHVAGAQTAARHRAGLSCAQPAGAATRPAWLPELGKYPMPRSSMLMASHQR